MKSRARELCDRHGYPQALSDVLEEVVALAVAHLGDVVSIVLSPSTSTGDFLWRHVGNEVELLSDIDGFIFVSASNADVEGFASAVRRLTDEVGGSMFHVDLAPSPVRALGRLPKTYQFVETGRAGFVLYGESPLPRFPRTFDPRASRQAFLMNLWKPLRCGFLAPDSDALAQAAARLLLDIPILASSERGECLPGHRARAQWFLDERPAPLGEDEEIAAAVAAAHAAREDPPGSVERLEPLLHPAIMRTVALLDGQGPFPADPGPAAVERLASWLPPRTPRRVFGELRSVLRRPTRPLADLHWLRDRKEASAGAALLGLFAYAASGPAGPPPEGIRERLSEFARRSGPGGEGLAFLRLGCALYREGLVELYPSFPGAGF
ncbi:MAG: hypothetical protein CL908_18290 [Deltaproteobacteria bacterium]|nr:hypothetical protein [Deltaproteobacteria bacterium]